MKTVIVKVSLNIHKRRNVFKETENVNHKILEAQFKKINNFSLLFSTLI